VKFPDKVPKELTTHNMAVSGECVQADSQGNPTEAAVMNVCCESDEGVLSTSLLEAIDISKHVYDNYVVMKNTCKPDETYGLDEKGRCRSDINNNGVLDRFADDECCLDCKPGAKYGRDDSGRCRTDVNNNGILDSFANSECCECDPKATYGRKDGRCRTDVNRNGLLDRFAKDVCCGAPEQSQASTSVESNLVQFPSRPGGDMLTFQGGCPKRESNGGNPTTWVASIRKCVRGGGFITVHGSSTTGYMSPAPTGDQILPTKCCKTASKCPAASVKIPDKVPKEQTVYNMQVSGECVAADSQGGPTEAAVENVCCQSD